MFGPWRAWVQGHQGIVNPSGDDMGTTLGVLRNDVFLSPKPAGSGERRVGRRRLPPRWRQSPRDRAPLRQAELPAPPSRFFLVEQNVPALASHREG